MSQFAQIRVPITTLTVQSANSVIRFVPRVLGQETLSVLPAPPVSIQSRGPQRPVLLPAPTTPPITSWMDQCVKNATRSVLLVVGLKTTIATHV